MKITIAAIGKDSAASPTYKMFEEYQKRVPWKIEIKELGEKKSLPTDKLKQKEAQMLLDSVPKADVIIALDENGKNLKSDEFAKKIVSYQDVGANNIVFLIGGAAGHGDLVKEKADLLLSLGKMTWPHMMVRAMLAEQIYRAYTIISGHPYHK